MKVFSFLFSFLLLAPPAFSKQWIPVVASGENRGYCEPTDDWMINYIKSYAKALADRQALSECSKAGGSLLKELASYTSTCKHQPRIVTGASYWYHCTVTVRVDCEVE